MRDYLRRQGITVARCTVERLMRANRWRGVTRARAVRTTIPDPAAARAPDLVKRNFKAGRPGQVHVADFTYVPLDGGGFGYTAFVIDAFAGLAAGRECSLAVPPTRRNESLPQNCPLSSRSSTRTRSRPMTSRPSSSSEDRNGTGAVTPPNLGSPTAGSDSGGNWWTCSPRRSPRRTCPGRWCSARATSPSGEPAAMSRWSLTCRGGSRSGSRSSCRNIRPRCRSPTRTRDWKRPGATRTGSGAGRSIQETSSPISGPPSRSQPVSIQTPGRPGTTSPPVSCHPKRCPRASVVRVRHRDHVYVVNK
jgi:hypothetical protein